MVQFELHKVSGTYWLLDWPIGQALDLTLNGLHLSTKLGIMIMMNKNMWCGPTYLSVNKRERSIVQIEYLTILVRFFSCNPTFFPFFHVGNK